MSTTGQYRNIGAPIRRNGVVVARRGETFEPTEDELRRKAYKLQPVVEEARPRVPNARAEAANVEAEPEPEVEVDELDQYSTGGGWYTLPGGERVRGKDKAIERLEELSGADE